MTNLNCEYVREMYPDVLNERVDAGTATAVRAHIARCADCREEAALLELLHANPAVVPAGLRERVTAGVKQAPATRAPRMRHLALAATVAAAVIGGAILFDGGDQRPAPDADGLGFVTVENTLVSGAASLQDLTVEELEQLLGEIES